MLPAHIRSLKNLSSRILLFSALLIAAPVFGATLTVTNTGDSGAGSLRDAIANASNGDTINFSLSYPATITVLTPLTFGPSVTITGPGSSNLAISGGNSVVVFVVNGGATVAISGVTVEQGSSLLGGGIFNAGTLTLTDSIVTLNDFGTQLGAGIFNAGTLTLTNCAVTDNSISSQVIGRGAGIYNNTGAVLTLNTSTISQNFGSGNGTYEGGGIYNDDGVVTLNNSTVSQNGLSANAAGTDARGAGIYNLNSGSLIVTNSTVSGNFASGVEDAGGGGIWNGFPEGHGSLKMTGSTVSGNHVQGISGGGGIKNAGVATITNSTISGNTATFNGSGGGIENNGVATVIASTISNNSTSGFGTNNGTGIGGGIDNPGGTITVKNSIVANNPNGNCVGAAGGTFLSDGYNLSDEGSCAVFFNGPGDMNNTPAGLDPAGLKNNGGPTQTIALQAGGAAVNAIPVNNPIECTDGNGIAITIDQRGTPRPQGRACDIGAFELFPSRLPIQAVEAYQVIDSVQSLSLPPVRQLVLIVPLQVAVDSLNLGLTNPAIVSLDVFVGLTKAMQKGGGLSAQQATPLITSAQQLVQELQNSQQPIP